MPSPGHAKTVSVTTVPPINPTRIRAEKVNGGIRAFLNACFQMTDLFLTPFARANLINSESRTSNIEDLTSLIKPAEANHPRVIAGITKCLNFSKALAASCPRVPEGNQSRFTENTNINIMPSQNGGNACPKTAKVLPKASRRVPRLTADIIPIGIPVISTNKVADSPSCRLAGANCTTISITGCPVLREVPKSPWKIPFPIHIKY